MWIVRVNKKAAKQLAKLPEGIQKRFDLLANELEVAGPNRVNWTNFGRLNMSKGIYQYHCHIKSGRPTYVVCWQIIDKTIQILEVSYVGTHENAPY